MLLAISILLTYLGDDSSPRTHSFVTASPDEFYDLLDKPYFVDKTELLERFFYKDPKHKTERDPTKANYFFISCPSGFGKTTNLNMLKNFAEYELYDNGTVKPYEQTKAYRVFSQLKISKYPNVIRKHIAQYALIYLDFNFRPDELTDDTTALAALRKRIADSIRPRAELILNVAKERGLAFLNKLLAEKTTAENIHRSAFYISKTLLTIGGRGVILLVDNFDTAIRHSISHPGLHGIKQLYNWIHLTIDTYVRFVLSESRKRQNGISMITSVTDLYMNSQLFEMAKYFRHCRFLQFGRFSAYFGFTEDETFDLLQKYNSTEEEKSHVRTYYEPYETDRNAIRLYSPVSVLQYLDSKQATGTGKLEPYWARNQSLDFVGDFSKARLFGAKLEELFSRNEFEIDWIIKHHDTTFFLSFLQDDQRRYENIFDEDAPSLFYYFFEHGFLKHSKSGCMWQTFTFANQEVKDELKRKLVEKGMPF